MTKIKLELISDPDMYIFFEKGTRGGISCNANRYSKANKKYLKSYDPKQDSKHIIYLFTYIRVDSSGQFPKEFDLNKYTSNSSKVCVLEVDLEYQSITRITQ